MSKLLSFKTLKISLLAYFFSACFFSANAQFEAASGAYEPYNPETLIRNILLGEGVEILNVQFDGNEAAVGYFNKGGNAIGLDQGVVLTTGVVETQGANIGIVEPGSTEASANNNSVATDPDIAQLAEGTDIFNLTKFTITFVPSSDQLSFNYVFASEEYPEFACTAYNDIFGFFISGPGFSGSYENGGENIALIPGTNLPVTINNIHPINPANGCAAEFEEFFNDNDGTSNLPIYDGYLNTFTALANVVPCETYTIKLVIADLGDSQRDSGVFFEAKSFNSKGLSVNAQTNSIDGTVVEGCTDGSFIISVDEPAAQDIPLDYTFIGTAQMMNDYTSSMTPVVLPAGATSVEIPIVPLEDGMTESIESIGLDIQINDCTRDTFWLYIRDTDLTMPELGNDTTICLGASVQLDGDINYPNPPNTVFTSTLGPQIVPSPAGNNPPTPVYMPLEVDGIFPPDLRPGLIQSVCMNIQHSVDEDLDVYLFSPGGQFIPLTTDNGETGNNYENTCFTPTAADEITGGFPNAPATMAPFTGDFQPEGTWTDLYFGDSPTNGTWRLLALDDETAFSGILQDFTITFNAPASITYEWSPATDLTCTDCPNPIATPSTTTTYTLTITDAYGCSVSDDITINVIDSYEEPVVSCTNITTSEITFTWNEVPFANGYEVSINNGTTWIAPNDTNTSHIVSGLGLGESVTLLVRALGECNAAIGEATCETINCTTLNVNITLQNVSCNGADDGEIHLTADGGIPPYTFELGAETNMTGDFTGLEATVHNVMITDDLGCETSVPLPISEPTALESMEVLINDIDCENPIGSGTATVSGGTAPYFYNWSNGQTDSIFTTMMGGEFQVTISDVNNCQIFDTIVINEEPTDVFDAPMVTCTNITMSEITFIWNDQPNNMGYEVSLDGMTWVTPNDSNISHTISGLSLGESVTLFVRALGDCVEIGEATCETLNCTPLTVDEMLQNVSCNGGTDGEIHLTTSGGTMPYTYTLGTETNMTGDFLNIAANTHNVVITDGAGCETTVMVTITEPMPLVSNEVLINDIDCQNTMGSATVTVTGGTAPYSFDWSNMQTDSILTTMTAGEFYVTITDLENCETLDTVVINEAAMLAVNAGSTGACGGSATGTAWVEITDGVAPFNILWDANGGNATTDTIQNLMPGNYQATVTDANNCEVIVLAMVNEFENFTLNTGTTEDDCSGTPNGTATVIVNGGSPEFIYAWNDAAMQNTPVAMNLAAGIYEVTVIDMNGCSNTATAEVNTPTALAIDDLSAIDATCNGGDNGSATVVASGGSGNFTYEWSDMQDNPTATNLTAGMYAVTVFDDAGCSVTGSIDVGEGAVMNLDFEVTNVLCANDVNGAIDLTVTGGDGNYSYNWSNAAMTQDLTNISANQYFVTVTDGNGCEIIGDATVMTTAPIELTFSNIEVSCYDYEDGEISVAVNGGQMPYTYAWSNGETTNTSSNIPAGDYMLTVTDANGCGVIENVELAEPQLFTAEIEAVMPSCFGDNDGSLMVTTIGGNPDYTYSMDGTNFTTENTFANLASGYFDLYVEDGNGCVFDTLDLYLDQPGEFVVEVGEDRSVELGDRVDLEALLSGGTTGTDFLWTTAEGIELSCNDCFNPVFFPNVSSTLQVLATDQNGCTSSDELTIYVDKNYRLYVPNAFSPNRDGMNDLFMPYGKDGIQIKTFQVLDRWGDLVFTVDDYLLEDGRFGWDGMFRGKEAKTGVYTWYIEAIFPDGANVLFKGDVTLIR